MSTTDRHQESYFRHIEELESAGDKQISVLDRPDSIDAHRHMRMFHMVTPLIKLHPAASWLTVGDGGGDAEMLKRLGVSDVVASCISDAHLIVVKERGFLNGIQVKALNAESVDLPDKSVDFVFCKEAFHHFPRPALGFYEFLRIARLGVFFIEPNDRFSTRPLDMLRTLVKIVLRGQGPSYEDFEPSGNYIYRLSHQEIYKVLAALGLPWFATRTLNDFYVERLSSRRQDDKRAMAVFNLGVGLQDLLSRVRLLHWGLMAAFIPASDIDLRTKTELGQSGYRIHEIPSNPYLAGSPRS